MDSVLAPNSADEAAQIVRDAIAERRPLEPVGGRVYAHVGYSPTEPLAAVDMRALTGIVDYAPEDLVVVARAGTTFAELQATLAAHSQRLPLEPAFAQRQTLGGIVASRAPSLTRASCGSVRDWLIGCKAVGGDGQMIHGGGKVVKNVAGYDLPKLYCGSWGTLGILTETAFRVAPAPEASQILLVTLNAERNSEDALDAVSQAVSPSFAHLLNTAAAREILGDNVPEAQFVAIGFDGMAESVAAMIRRAEAALAADAFQILLLPTDVAARLRMLLADLPAQDAPLSVRCSILPSQVGAFARMIEWTSRRSGFTASVVSDALGGTLWARVRPRDAEEGDSAGEALNTRWMRLYPELKDKIDRVGGSTVVERMPDAWRRVNAAVWTPPRQDARWMHGLKATLDPHGIFRPGRFMV